MPFGPLKSVSYLGLQLLAVYLPPSVHRTNNIRLYVLFNIDKECFISAHEDEQFSTDDHGVLMLALEGLSWWRYFTELTPLSGSMFMTKHEECVSYHVSSNCPLRKG